MKKSLILTFVLLGQMIPFTTQASAQISLDAVLKECGQKMIVMGRDENGKMVKVGERIDDYCRGVLEGMFALLVHSEAICVKDTPATPDFLLSTVLTYRTQTHSTSDDAAAVIEAAFKRAFTCSK
ncbi:MAG TPA: hypothetical protein VFT69_12445 [Pseudolabrys sp.]|nr:hypothetical protein [Pseudolabrys sp.]